MELYDQLISKLRLKSEATQVIICLEEYLANFFLPKAQTDLKPYFESVRPDVSQVLQDALLKANSLNQTEIKKMVLELEDKLRKCPVIQLTLAFQPDDEAITLFSESVKRETNANTLIELQYDRTIVGGALIVANGKYKDYSVRKKLSDRFQIQREDIMGLLS